jgi:ABC-type polysaccharide/polyol phosphate export permease
MLRCGQRWQRAAPASRVSTLTERSLQRLELVWCLVVRDLRVRYRRSTLGLLWTMLLPLLHVVVFTTVFSTAFGFHVENYAVYALAGVLFWNFFQQSVLSSMNSLARNASILKKLPVPRAVFPVATVLAGAVNLCLALVPLFVLLLVTGHPLTPALLFLPAGILLAALFALGVGLLLSPLAIFFTDVVELVGVVLTLVMYLTPVFYPPAIVPPRFRWVVELNPVGVVLEAFRDPIYRGALPSGLHLSLALVMALGALGIGIVAFRRSSDRIPFYL